VEPHLGVVFDALKGVNRAGRFVQERTRTVHVVIFLVLPATTDRVTPDRTRVLVGLDLEALLHDVLDDPKTFFDLHLQNAKLVAIPNFNPREFIGTDVNSFGCA
jgi:hypothetical protein